MTISPIQIPTAGDQHILTCTAIVNEYLIAAATLEWRFPVIVAGVSTGAQSTIGAHQQLHCPSTAYGHLKEVYTGAKQQ